MGGQAGIGLAGKRVRNRGRLACMGVVLHARPWAHAPPQTPIRILTPDPLDPTSLRPRRMTGRIQHLPKPPIDRYNSRKNAQQEGMPLGRAHQEADAGG